MSQDVKTDNQNLSQKLFLRRYFLKKYHTGRDLHVLDACQGAGKIWASLKSEFTLKSYWGVDRKSGALGRIRIDSEKILTQPGWAFNVVDIDVYGSPWKHWTSMLPQVTRPVTVFMTIGHVLKGGGSTDYFSLYSMAWIFPRLKFPVLLESESLSITHSLIASMLLD